MSTSRDKLGQVMRLKEVYAACLSVMLGVVPAYAQQSNNTSVGNFQVQAGNAAIAASADPKQVVINLSNNKSVLQWDRLNVPIGATLQFSQPNAQSVVLNRVVSVDPARIDGVMNSNGQVWILSGSGVLFGKNSQVNVQGLMASTRDISNADFLAGKYAFSGGGAGKVSNLGDISVADGGYVLLVGSEVDNQGRIQAQLGQVKLASGKAFVLDLHGDKLLRFDVTEALTGGDGQASKVSNAGQMVADGGAVQMTARAANGLVAQVVNTGGLLQANSARMVNGQIVLDAGPGGEVVAGGQISTQGLDAAATGGSVTVVGDKITLPSDSRINASGQAGGGTVLVGGDWQGSGSLQQATRVDMQAGAEIKANATSAGDGGKVVLWSDIHKDGGSTTVAGAIQAKGGANAGAGGNVETSGHMLNIAESANVNAMGANDQAGNWLLDPVNVTIDTAAAGVIQTALGGSNVMVTTNGAAANAATYTNVREGESAGVGDITVNAPITWSNNTLSLHADGNITINSILNYQSGGAGGLDLHVGYKNAGNLNGTPPDYNTNKVLKFGRDSSGFIGKFNVSSDGAFKLNSNSYVVISDLTQLQNINTNKSGRFALAADINASASSSLNGGAGFVPLGDSGAAFTGSFIGLGHTISGLVINRPTEDYVGLFGSTNGAQVSNVGMVNATISGRGQVGGFTGQMKNGELKNAYLQSSNVTGLGEVGGLVGRIKVDDASKATIVDSFYTGNVTGTSGGSIGGLIGLIYIDISNYADILIQNNYSNVILNSASSNVGGLIGNLKLWGAVRLNVFDNFSKGSVTSTLDGVGGFLGVGDLNACGVGVCVPGILRVNRNYSTAAVSGRDGVGGFAGALWDSYSDSAFQDNYATGNVTVGSGQTGGGFIGYNQVTHANSYSTGSVAGGGTLGGVIGNNWANLTNLYWNSASAGQVNGVGTNSGGTLSVYDLTSVQMNKQSNFNGFDFSSVSAPWTIYEGYTAPLLKSFLTPLVVTAGSPTVATKVYDGTTSYAGTGTVSYSAVPGVSLLGTLGYSTAAKNVGSQQIQVGGLYSDQQGYLISYVNNLGSVNVTAAPLTVTASTVTKTYDGTTTATGSGTTASLAGAGAGETLFAAPQVFTNKNVGTGKKVQVTSATVKDSGGVDVTSNYQISLVDNESSVINPATLTVTGTTVADKTYDGTNVATLSNGSLQGVMAGDAGKVSLVQAGTFADKNVGANKVVTAADTINGLESGNYQLTQPTGLAADINYAALNVTATTASKTYDGTTTAPGTASVGALAGSGAGEYVASATQTFTSKNVGTGKKVQATGVTIKDGVGNEVTNNYQISYVDDQTGVITQAPLTLAADAQTKVFDGTVASTKNPNVFGLKAGDSVTGSAQVFDAAAIGARTLSVASYTVNDGNSGNNYAVTLQTANGAINAAPLATPAVEEQATQSVQTALASVSSGITQLSSTSSVITAPATSSVSKSSTSTTAQAPSATSTTATQTQSSSTATASTTQPTATAQSSTTTNQASATSGTTETASISVSSQPAQTANLNAANTTTANAPTTAATGAAATEAKPQVTMVSMTATNVSAPTSVGVQSIAPIQTPTAPEDQRDPVLAAVSSFKPAAVLSASSGRGAPAKGREVQVVVPLVQGVLALETVPPKAASQTVDEQRLSGAGNRSRW